MKKFLHKNILIAGRTGSGKSNFMHNLIVNLLEENSPADLRLVLIEPKRIEFAQYNGISHLLAEVIYDSDKARSALKWTWGESLRRLKIIQEADSASIYKYNKIKYRKNKLPEIYIIIDEFSDLMAADSKFFEEYFEKITALSKMTGVYLLVASAKVIPVVFTKRINNCFVDRICFKTFDENDSLLLLGEKGAEKLSNPGSCLVKNLVEFKIKNKQMPCISDEEIAEKIKVIKEKYKDFDFSEASDEEESDELYELAKGIVVNSGKASTSLLQRKLRIGYSRASRLMDMLEERRVVGPANGAEPREIFIKK